MTRGEKVKQFGGILLLIALCHLTVLWASLILSLTFRSTSFAAWYFLVVLFCISGGFVVVAVGDFLLRRGQ